MFQVSLKPQRNILISPLEWGLGHAARMIPVARRLAEMGNNVYVAAGETHLALFRTELPGIKCIDFPGFSPKYSKFLPQYLSLLLKSPVLLYYIIYDHHRLKKIINEYNIDLVISDNRFGLWTDKVKCIYVTHMPRIPLPSILRILEITGILLHRYIIKRYSFCFIPDLPGEINLSGRLSHGITLPSNVHYIGILSRFIEHQSQDIVPTFESYNTIILSGPEPQRGILKEKLIRKFKTTDKTTFVLEGKPGEGEKISKSGNIIFQNHLHTAEFYKVLKSSDLIVSRSGYTTIMDLAAIGRTALLIPTPGQTEQEYLAEYLAKRQWFSFIMQDEIEELKDMVIPDYRIPEEIAAESKKLFELALIKMLEQDHKNGQG